MKKNSPLSRWIIKALGGRINFENLNEKFRGKMGNFQWQNINFLRGKFKFFFYKNLKKILEKLKRFYKKIKKFLINFREKNSKRKLIVFYP